MPKKSHCANIRRIAVIGSGISGLSSAILLQDKGHQVVVFEKSRGPGGRLASKRVPKSSADIGAQYFTARNPEFLPFLTCYAGPDSFRVWEGKLGFRDESGEWSEFPREARYVGTPRMTAISRQLSAHVEMVAETRIATFQKRNGLWDLTDTNGQSHTGFDQIILTAPPAQTQTLLEDSELQGLADSLNDAVSRVLPCWAVAAHFHESPFHAFPWRAYSGARVEHPVLYWVGNNSSKPERDDQGEWWVLHANAEWTQANVDQDPEKVAQLMCQAFTDMVGFDGEPTAVVPHRWLYARSEGGETPGHLWYPEQGIGIAGDWLAGGRVEGAFDSAWALISAIEH